MRLLWSAGKTQTPYRISAEIQRPLMRKDRSKRGGTKPVQNGVVVFDPRAERRKALKGAV